MRGQSKALRALVRHTSAWSRATGSGHKNTRAGEEGVSQNKLRLIIIVERHDNCKPWTYLSEVAHCAGRFLEHRDGLI